MDRSDDVPRVTGPPDRQTLRLLDRQMASDSLVVTTAFDPDSFEPQRLRVVLDAEQYPPTVVAARLDIRWFTTGDFSVHYVETHDPNSARTAVGSDSARWECRWNRHPNGHSSRLHFHQPPAADSVIDLSMQSVHPLDVYATVMTAINNRVETLWDDQPDRSGHGRPMG